MQVFHLGSRICALALTLLLATQDVQAQTNVAPLSEQIDGYMQRVADTGFSGVVLVAEGDEVTLHSAYGLANDAAATPFTPETVVDVGSLAKQFTATAILQLEQRGLLQVDDPLNAFFSPVPADRAAITIHQLLTHSAGLPDHVTDDLSPMTRDEAREIIFGDALLFTPGTEYRYCNACYTMLALIVEKVSGQDFTAYMHSQLFATAGLEATGFYQEERWRTRLVANGYFNGVDHGSPAQWPGPYWGVLGNGGVLSTAEDLRRWWQALRTYQVLAPEQTAKLFARQIAQPDEGFFYGYGWAIEPSALGEMITHNGGGIGGNSDLAYFPERDLLLILLGNRIVYRMIGDLPYDVHLYASDTRRQLQENIASGDFSPLPTPTFSIFPVAYYGFAALLACVALAFFITAKLQRSRRPDRF
jgi:CubicO group peptidase (beta-lactamase class C family)